MSVLRWIPLLGILLGWPAAADEPGASPLLPEEPGLSQRPSPVTTTAGFWARRPRGPRLELSWRTFDLAEQGGRQARYHVFGAQHYIISRLLRLGAGFEGGFDDTPRGNFLLNTGVSLGVQWPARLTPFLDLVTALGLLRFDVLHDNLVCFTWQVGLEAGLHFFVHPRAFMSVALGWRRFVYRHPGDQTAPKYIYNDTLSVRLGLGY